MRSVEAKKFIKEAELIFDRFTSRDDESAAIKKSVPIKSKYYSNEKENNDNKSNGSRTRNNLGKTTTELSFYIFPPPPPPPPPSYMEENNNLDFAVEMSPDRTHISDIHNNTRPGMPNLRSCNPPGHVSSKMSSYVNPQSIKLSAKFDRNMNGDISLQQTVDEEDDSDEIDGDDDMLFEEVSKEEQQRRVEEVSKMLDTIVEKEFGYGLHSGNMRRASSSASIASLTQSLASDLSYSSFKSHLSSFIQSHNDKLVKQIGLMFYVARSAMEKVGKSSAERKEIKKNTLQFYDEHFVPQVVEFGGLGGLMQSSKDEN